MARLDLILDDDKNLQTLAGDLVTGDADAQNVDLLLLTTKASFKESPTIGAGLIHWLKKPDTNLRSMRREITVQLAADGYKSGDFTVDENNEFNIEYEINY